MILLTVTSFATETNQSLSKENQQRIDINGNNKNYKLVIDPEKIPVDASITLGSEQNSIDSILQDNIYGPNKVIGPEGPWPFYYTATTAYNCYGYASQFQLFINPGYYSNQNFEDYGIQYFNVNVLAEIVEEDFEKEGRNCRKLSSQNDSLKEGEYLIVLRTGVHDYNGDNRITLGSECDYHFMVKNSDGGWSHKAGKTPTQYLGNINPSTYNWNLGENDYFYDSQPIYMAVEADW